MVNRFLLINGTLSLFVFLTLQEAIGEMANKSILPPLSSKAEASLVHNGDDELAVERANGFELDKKKIKKPYSIIVKGRISSPRAEFKKSPPVLRPSFDKFNFELLKDLEDPEFD